MQNAQTYTGPTTAGQLHSVRGSQTQAAAAPRAPHSLEIHRFLDWAPIVLLAGSAGLAGILRVMEALAL